MASTTDLIKRYQHTIEKYSNDEPRVLHCIEKLHQLKVTVAHLQETGVGRTVNALRKQPGDIGNASRALVNKWKLMVAAEESSEPEDHAETTTYNGNGYSKDTDDNTHKTHQSQNNNDQASHSSSSTSRQNEYHNNDRSMNGDHSATKRSHHSREKYEPESKKSKYEEPYSRDIKIKQEKLSSESDSHNSDSDSDQSESSVDESKDKIKIKTEPEENEHAPHSSSQSYNSNSKISKSNESSSEKHSHHSKESRSSYDKYSKERSSSSTVDKSKESDRKHHQDRKSDKEKSSSSRHSSKSEKHSSSHKQESSSEKHRSVSSKSDKDKHKSSSKSEKHESDKHKNVTEKHKESSSKDKHHSSEKEKSRDKSSSKEKSSHSKSERSHKSSSDRNKDKSESSSSSSSKKESKNKSSSSSHKSSRKNKEIDENVPKKKKSTNSEDSDDGIDCGSGASFAEALGMSSPAKAKKKSSKESISPRGATDKLDLTPAALLAPTARLAPLPPLEISALPEISPNYKPRPPPKFLPHFNDEDAMNCVISSKSQRTKVYSGTKVYGKLPSLYELCVHVLQEHIDALEYTGGVPYEILKPVVDRATPQQLSVLEHYNPYLMEDTDHLWQKFCEKHFRSQKRQEMETWREMYMRCQEERESKLKSLTANIRIAQEAKKAPIKQTKMAYVDSVVKPPRNIARKQALNGTGRAAVASPAARVAALATAPLVMRAGTVRPPPAVAVSSNARPKKAPLMQKALQLMRGRKR